MTIVASILKKVIKERGNQLNSGVRDALLVVTDEGSICKAEGRIQGTRFEL